MNVRTHQITNEAIEISESMVAVRAAVTALERAFVARAEMDRKAVLQVVDRLNQLVSSMQAGGGNTFEVIDHGDGHIAIRETK